MALVKEYLRYEPDSGKFFWIKEPRPNRPLLGKEAGRIQKHGIGITLRGHRNRVFLAHRLAWYVMHGELDILIEIDHKNRNPYDNRIENLRLADLCSNRHNTLLPNKNNKTSGVRGVCFDKKEKKWIAAINCRGRRQRIGAFDRLEDAKAARQRVASELYGEFYAT